MTPRPCSNIKRPSLCQIDGFAFCFRHFLEGAEKYQHGNFVLFEHRREHTQLGGFTRGKVVADGSAHRIAFAIDVFGSLEFFYLLMNHISNAI